MLRFSTVFFLVGLFSFSVFGQSYDAADIQFSHFKLDDQYVISVANKEPFDNPCDIDQIDDERSVAYYQGSACRGRTFPEDTTVIMFLGEAEQMKLKTMIWIKGTYFNERSNFPLAIGQSEEEVLGVLGVEEDSFTYARGGFSMKAVRFSGRIIALLIDGKAYGYVVGDMPADWRDNQWFQVAGIIYDHIRNGEGGDL